MATCRTASLPCPGATIARASKKNGRFAMCFCSSAPIPKPTGSEAAELRSIRMGSCSPARRALAAGPRSHLPRSSHVCPGASRSATYGRVRSKESAVQSAKALRPLRSFTNIWQSLRKPTMRHVRSQRRKSARVPEHAGALKREKGNRMADQPNEATVLNHIQKLVGEEHELFDRASLDDAETRRLAAIQVELDQCWDLLRQRRALRETGRDANEAHVRPPEVVEKYVG